MNNDECSICLEDINIETPVSTNPFKILLNKLEKKRIVPITTNCNHTFHKKCIQKWKRNKYSKSRNLCPICRSEMFKKHNYKYILAVAQVDKHIPTGNIIRLPMETCHKLNTREFNLILAREQMVLIKIISCKKIKPTPSTPSELSRDQELENGILLY